MKTTLKVEKIETSGSGVKFVHIELKFIGASFDDITFKIQCTGFALVLKSNHNTISLCNFLTALQENRLENKIQCFVDEVIKADAMINQIKEIK